MPRIAGLLFICSLLHIRPYCAGFGRQCQKPEWFRCDNGRCISFTLECDGEDDCGDMSDEKDCSTYSLTIPASIECTEDEYKCLSTGCIPIGKFCDGVFDCSDTSDEYEGCVKELNCKNKFRCQDGHCVSKEWVCDNTNDCPDGSDESNCDNETLSAHCKKERDGYLCDNKKCIPFSMVCNKEDNCGDGSDEGAGCESGTLSCASAGCNHACRGTPSGLPICTCQPGYELRNNRTCIDTNECMIYGICDQECVNTVGSYKCNCQGGYSLQDDMRTCKADGGEATMIFSTGTEIRGVHLDSQIYFIAEGNLSHAVGVAVDGEYMYWSETKDHSEEILKCRIGEKKEIIVSSGLHRLSDIAVDWITGNIYFTDNGYNHIGVCDNNGSYCTILTTEPHDGPRGLALSPNNGTMYWCSGRLYSARIKMAGMDGKNSKSLVVEDLEWPVSVTLDYPSNRLYWVDAKSKIIESIRLDGTDRRTVLYDIAENPLSLAIFENKLYWSDSNIKTIQSCNKFSGKDWKILIRTSNTPNDIHIDHPAIKPKGQNPCHSNPCSQLCLLNRNKGYTCACTLEEELSFDKRTCRGVKERQHFLIVAGGTIIDYYHELLGKLNTTVQVTQLHITAVSYDSISGMVFLNDQSTGSMLRYDPIGRSFHMFSQMIYGRMAFDHIGNNLYSTDMRERAINVQSMTTLHNTTFYYEEKPYDIALVPEAGLMFVVFEDEHSYRIDKMQMNGLGTRTHIVEKLLGPMISVCYDREEKLIFWSDEGKGVIEYADLSGLNRHFFRVQLPKPVNLAVTEENVFWTLRDSNLLYWTNKSPHSLAYNRAISIGAPDNVILYVISLRGLIVHSNYGCRRNNGNCSQVCLPTSIISNTCACSSNMTLSADNRTCNDRIACPSGEIKCSKHDICIKQQQWCNGIRDCPNGEDEPSDCKEAGICGENHFMCKSGECVNSEDRCNSHYDCADKSDEDDCDEKKCKIDEFRCHEGNCISNFLICNGQNDCPDFSDELHCSTHTCPPDNFMCDTRKCIPKDWECDGEADCQDGSDEKCEMSVCGDDRFECANGRCISSSLKCNSFDDCGDESDERDCVNGKNGQSANCTVHEYLCYNTDICIPKRLRCNGMQDCPKNDDEHNCAYCSENQFTCDNKKCIEQSWVCDRVDDCGDKSDEKNCGSGNLNNLSNINVNVSDECEEFRCSTGACLPFTKVCDTVQDCPDGSDESAKCNFSCLKGDRCQSLCYKTPQGGVCGCQEGYRLATDMISCDDINECTHDICSQICHNTAGSFKCSCHDGYVLRSDGISCKAIGPSMEIITVTYNDIRKLSSNLRSVEVLHPLVGLSVTGFDVNAIDDTIYWNSDELSVINKLNIKTKELKIIKDIGSPGVLAVDWITNNIYFNDNGRPNMIKVCNLEQQKCAALVKIEGLARVESFVIDPENRWLFWSQTTWQMYDNPSSEICRTNMMGSNMKTIVFRNLGVVSGMAIDHTKSRLYWTDRFYETIESSHLDGTERNTFLKTNMYQPLGISIYENSLYWLIRSNNQLQKCKLYGEKSCVTMDLGPGNIHKHFAILHVSRHPLVENSCKELNCDYMCVLNDNSTACICQDGKLIEPNSTCPEDKSIDIGMKNIGQRTNSFAGVIVMIMIVIMLLSGYCYYQRTKSKTSRQNNSNSSSFSTVHFQNSTYDRIDEVEVILNPIPTNLSPGKHEYTNPIDERLLKESSASETSNSGQSREEIEIIQVQDISCI